MFVCLNLQAGAVVFMPFQRHSSPDYQRVLGLTEDHFLLKGHQLGSGFGAVIEVLDLNNDG